MKSNAEEVQKILSSNIKTRRENLKISQEKLAETANLSIQTINDIEGGRKWVSAKSLTRLAKALNIEIFQLFMPHRIQIDKLDAQQAAVLLEFWQRTKLSVEKMNLQIDDVFKEVLKSPLHQHNEKAPEAQKPKTRQKR